MTTRPATPPPQGGPTARVIRSEQFYVFVGPDARAWAEAWTVHGHSVLPTPHTDVNAAIEQIQQLNPGAYVDQLLAQDIGDAMTAAIAGGHFPGEGGPDCRHCDHPDVAVMPRPVAVPDPTPDHQPTPDTSTHQTQEGSIPMTTMSAMSFRTTGTAGGGFTTQASPFAAPGGLGSTPETTADLRAQARQADALAEQLQLLTGVITNWRSGLADRLAGATWGTEQINAAADALTGTGEDLTALQDGLSALAQACQDAITVGAEAAAQAATGAAEGFQAQ